MTKEAYERMGMIPPMAKGVAMKAIQNYCLAKGHTMVTTKLLNEAIRTILPSEAIERMGIDLESSSSFNQAGDQKLIWDQQALER
ncbi:MAG: hypothetical protein AAB276_07445, partial [Pseudomonadota bacterium]